MKLPDVIRDIEAGRVEELARKLTQFPDSVNFNAKYSVTPLIRAVQLSNVELVDLLLKMGADPNKEVRGENPIGAGIKANNSEIVEILLKAGADPSARSICVKGPPLVYAAESGYASIVKVLIEYGAEVDAATSAFGYAKDGSLGIGRTALMEAAVEGHLEIVRMLLEAGADAWFKGVERKTARDLVARRKGRRPVAELLCEWMRTHSPKAGSRVGSKSMGLSIPFYSWDEALQRLQQATSEEGTPHSQVKSVVRFPWSLEAATSLVGEVGDQTAREIYRESLIKVQTLSSQLSATWFLQFEPLDNAFLCGLRRGDKWKVLGAFKTSCANYGVTPTDLLKFLKSLDSDHPFELVECDFSSMAGRFQGELIRPEKVAQRLLEFCPFVAEDDGGSVKRLAESLATSGYFKIWWD